MAIIYIIKLSFQPNAVKQCEIFVVVVSVFQRSTEMATIEIFSVFSKYFYLREYIFCDYLATFYIYQLYKIDVMTFRICTYIFLPISKPRKSTGEWSYFLMLLSLIEDLYESRYLSLWLF